MGCFDSGPHSPFHRQTTHHNAPSGAPPPPVALDPQHSPGQGPVGQTGGTWINKAVLAHDRRVLVPQVCGPMQTRPVPFHCTCAEEGGRNGAQGGSSVQLRQAAGAGGRPSKGQVWKEIILRSYSPWGQHHICTLPDISVRPAWWLDWLDPV